MIVHTGKGKGKSTAAFGLVFRALGNGMKVGIVQFVKGKWETGERQALERFPGEVTITAMGDGFTWETQDRQRDIAAARQAWERAKAMITDEEHHMVVLDELNIVLRYEYIPVEEVVDFLRDHKPEMKHVVITGATRATNSSSSPTSSPNGDGQAPVPLRHQGAARHRVLTRQPCSFSAGPLAGDSMSAKIATVPRRRPQHLPLVLALQRVVGRGRELAVDQEVVAVAGADAPHRAGAAELHEPPAVAILEGSTG